MAERRRTTVDAVGAEAERRQGGIARLFYPGRHARRASTPPTPGEEVYRLVGEIVDPDDVVFFDWSPSADHVRPGPAGEIVLMTARSLTHVTYRPALEPGAGVVAVATDVAVHRLERVRSLRWSAAEPDVVAANGHRKGVVIVGDELGGHGVYGRRRGAPALPVPAARADLTEPGETLPCRAGVLGVSPDRRSRSRK